MKKILKDIYDHILDGQNDLVESLAREALSSSIDPKSILDAMISAMAEVGRLFEAGEFYVPEMMVAARAMQAGLGIIKPALARADVATTGKVLSGTVKGDLHDIGKKLVGMMLEGAGFEVVDLGTDVSPEKLVEAVRADRPDLVAMSALLTTTMLSMKEVIEALTMAGVRTQVKVMIGGAPVTEEFARRIGADGYAADASRAVDLAKALMSV